MVGSVVGSVAGNVVGNFVGRVVFSKFNIRTCTFFFSTRGLWAFYFEP